jgi:hypothetical protein
LQRIEWKKKDIEAQAEVDAMEAQLRCLMEIGHRFLSATTQKKKNFFGFEPSSSLSSI